MSGDARGGHMVITPPPGLRTAGSSLMGTDASDELTGPGALMEAVTDLTRCGSAPDLYVVALAAETRGRALGKELPEEFATRDGARSQTRFARNCILFSALSAGHGARCGTLSPTGRDR
jgi:hypothetical protein